MHADRVIGSVRGCGLNECCFIVAEVAQAHDGSLGAAHAYIDAVARASADAVKFQTHIAAAESTADEPWRVKFSQQDRSRYDYWKRMEFTEAQWLGLRDHAVSLGLKFLSSPFSLEAAEMLERVGVAAWKVASGEVSNQLMFEELKRTGLPILLSSGMSTWEELDGAVSLVKEAGLDLTVMQCTSVYPTPAEKLGLNIIPELRQRYGCKVGLSDHSGTLFAGLAAATIGIDALEVHVTLSREAFGPDVTSSVTTQELRDLVAGVRFIERARAHPVDKDQLAAELAPVRELFTKSLVARVDLATGVVLKREDIAVKKPGTGIPATLLTEVLGRRVRRAVGAGQMLSEEDLEP